MSFYILSVISFFFQFQDYSAPIMCVQGFNFYCLPCQVSSTEALEGGRKDGKTALGRGLSPTTVSQHHRVLREALQHALELEIIARKLYSHLAPTLQKEAADRLDNVLFKK